MNSNEIYVSGYANELGMGYDFVTIKYNNSSSQLWVSKYNGPGNDIDIAYDLTIDNSGNAYITGESKSGLSEFTKDYATVKYNLNGTLQWVKRYNGPANNQDVPSSIANAGNDVVYVTGKSTGVNSGFDYATTRYSNQWLICENEESLSDNLNDVYIVNKDTAFAVGNNGKLISTFNKGKHWNVLNGDVSNDLLKLRFIDNNSGIIVGDSIILKTTNCGLNWNKLQVPFTNLGDASILNNRISSIPCSNGRILKSNDLWNTFTIQNTNLNENIIKVFYSDSLNGKGISQSGKLIKTTNGGVSWNNISNLNITKINNAFFKNTNTIIAVGDSGKILYSSNGGFNWSGRNINRNIILKSVYLDDENQLYINGENGLILYSSDFGVSWKEQPTNILSQINDLGFFDRNSGVAITDEGQILLTSLGTIETGSENVLSSENSDLLNNNQQNLIGFELYQNYPNTFNPKTQIKFVIPENTFVLLKVYDILGKEVYTLINENLEKGNHSVNFDGSDLSNGLYFYKIFAGNYVEQKQMLPIK